MGRALDAISAGDALTLRDVLGADHAQASERDESGVSLLMNALYRGRRDLGEIIVEHHNDLDVFEAAAFGDTARLQALLDDNSDLAAAWSPDGFTALHFAAFLGTVEGLQVLLDAGSDISAVGRGFLSVQPLHSAASTLDTTKVALLISRGADVNATQDGGFTTLHAAAFGGSDELVDLLRAHGADASATTDEGKVAADFAREKGFTSLADRLASVETS